MREHDELYSVGGTLNRCGRRTALEQAAREGDSPVCGASIERAAFPESRVVLYCSPKWEINFF